MVRHDGPESSSPAERPGLHQLLPITGGAVAVVAVLAHLAGGAALLHLGLGGGLANLNGAALVVGLAAVIAVKLLLIIGARRWFRHRHR